MVLESTNKEEYKCLCMIYQKVKNEITNIVQITNIGLYTDLTK